MESFAVMFDWRAALAAGGLWALMCALIWYLFLSQLRPGRHTKTRPPLAPAPLTDTAAQVVVHAERYGPDPLGIDYDDEDDEAGDEPPPARRVAVTIASGPLPTDAPADSSSALWASVLSGDYYAPDAPARGERALDVERASSALALPEQDEPPWTAERMAIYIRLRLLQKTATQGSNHVRVYTPVPAALWADPALRGKLREYGITLVRRGEKAGRVHTEARLIGVPGR